MGRWPARRPDGLACSPGLRAFAMFVVRVIRRLHATRFARIAASLAFTTLLGLVPLFTVAFAYVAPLPAVRALAGGARAVPAQVPAARQQRVARDSIWPSSPPRRRASRASASRSSIVTAVLLVAQVEREINAIWGIVRRRARCRGGSSSTRSGFVAGPALIGAAVYCDVLADRHLGRRRADRVGRRCPMSRSRFRWRSRPCCSR